MAMTGKLPHGAVVLAWGTTWRPSRLTQSCEFCQAKYDGPECPYCGDPADQEQVSHVVVAFTTADGRHWVLWATHGADGRWEAERLAPALTGDLLGEAS